MFMREEFDKGAGSDDNLSRLLKSGLRTIYRMPLDSANLVATAPLVGDSLRYAALGVHFGPLFVSFGAMRQQIKHLPKAEKEKAILDYCERHKDAPLKAVLGMGGFYIKIGQVLSGIPGLPRPWQQSLKTLQRDVPPRNVQTMIDQIESDFGCSLKAVGLTDISTKPLGSASIGQAHLARLHGREVVVKVMYPEVERFFKVDFAMILRLIRGVNEELVEPLERMQELFEAEFDYTREAANLRRMCETVGPRFAHTEPPVSFPQPYDAKRYLADNLPPLPPGTRVAAAGGLVTRRVLVMDLCHGETITEIADGLLERLAASHGLTGDAYREQMRQQAMAAAKQIQAGGGAEAAMSCMLAAREPVIRVRQGCAMAAHAAANAVPRLINSIADLLGVSEEAPLRLPLSPPPISLLLGPGLVDRIVEVHAHQVFEEGAFNADPHAGNCLLDTRTGRLTLIDYGQLTELTFSESVSFAYYCIAGATNDAELAQASYVGMGFDVVWKGALVLNESRTGTTRVRDPTQRVACVPPPGWVCLNTFHVDYGTPAQAMAALRLYGIDPFSGGEVDGAEEGVFELIKQLFEVRRVPGAYGMLQRMSLCLKGLGNAVGMMNLSLQYGFAAHARRFLAKHGYGPRDLDAAARGRPWASKAVESAST